MWPVYLQIANLPPLLQFRQDNIITCGIWVGQSKPNMDTLLTPILQDIDHIDHIDHINAVGSEFLFGILKVFKEQLKKGERLVELLKALMEYHL